MKQRRVGAAVALGAAAFLLVPAVASAQVRFGMGGYRGGYSGYSPGYYNNGYAPGYYGYAPGWNSYSPGYTTYGGYPYPGYSWRSGGYVEGYNYPSYGTTDFYYNTPATSSYYGSGYAGDVGSSYQYGTRSGASVRDAALLNVRVPDANAEVWVEGKLTQQRGTWREYESPALNPDKSYTYEVRARWTENGKTVERTKTVPVKANGVATADFTASANNSRVDDIDRGRDDNRRTNPGADTNRTNPGTNNSPNRTNPGTDANPRPGGGNRTGTGDQPLPGTQPGTGDQNNGNRPSGNVTPPAGRPGQP